MIKRSISDEQELLSYDEYTFIIGIVVESVDIEITRLPNDKVVETIASYLFSLYLSTDYFAIFTLAGLQKTTVDICDVIIVRDFILNLTDRISLSLPLTEKDEDRFIKTLVRGICRNKTNSDNSLFVKEINDSLYINPEVLTTCLKDNFWLIVVYIISIHFHKTQIYHTFKEQESS